MKRTVAFLLSILTCFLIGCSAPTKSADNTSALTTTAQTTDTPTTPPPTTAPEEPPKEPDPLLAGFAERDFTPTKKGGSMPGSSSVQTANGVEMPLLTNAAAFESGDTAFILISIDILRLTEYGVSTIREKINENTGVPKENIMLVATHTHRSVGLDIQHNQNKPDKEAYEHMIDMSVEAATEAWNGRAPIKYGHGKTILPGYSFCRDLYLKNGDIKTWHSGSQILKPISEVDRSVNVMRFDDTDGNIKCFIVNYANHPDSSSGAKYNSDYPGYARELLKEKYGEDVTILYLNGAEGDVNYCDYENGAKAAGNNKTIGTALATVVIRLNDSIVADAEYAEISSISRMHDAPQQKPTADDILWARETLKKIENGESVANLDKKYAIEYTTYDFLDWGDTFEIEIQTMVLGDFAFVGLPCETYSEIGLRIKEETPYENTFVISLANLSYGYMAPDFVYGTSAYPARFSPSSARTDKGIADVLVNGSVSMLNEIKNN